MSSVGNLFDESLTDLYDTIFGGKPIKTNVFDTTKDEVKEGTNSNNLFAKKTSSTTRLGSSLYDTETLSFGREYYLPVTLNGIRVPYAVMRIQGRKTIVETDMVNRRGSVKELISIDDYVIKLTGFFISETRELPDDQITMLKNLHEKQESIILRSALSDIFLSADDKVVIRGFEMPSTKGIKGVKPFEIDLVSDQEFALIID